MSGVTVKNLNVAYGEKVVFDGLDLTFEEGKINVILGGSGVGKTTLLNAVAGLVPYGGEIIGAEDGVSFIFQKDRLIPSISVYKNLDLVLKTVFKDKHERAEKINNMLAALEISDQADKLPTELSGGQAQRAAMARAFLFPSKVLLMDEPFKALDTALKAKLLKVFVELNEQNPRTVIFVTHAIDECLLTADRAVVLDGTPAKCVYDTSIDSKKLSRSLADEELNEVRLNLLQRIIPLSAD